MTDEQQTANLEDAPAEDADTGAATDQPEDEDAEPAGDDGKPEEGDS